MTIKPIHYKWLERVILYATLKVSAGEHIKIFLCMIFFKRKFRLERGTQKQVLRYLSDSCLS